MTETLWDEPTDVPKHCTSMGALFSPRLPLFEILHREWEVLCLLQGLYMLQQVVIFSQESFFKRRNNTFHANDLNPASPQDFAAEAP